MTVFNSTYVLNSAAARRQLDLQFRSAFLAWGEQSATVTGTGQVDAVYAHAGVSVDFTASGASVDTLYLDGNLADYVVTVSGNVLTLSRAASGAGATLVPASTYKLTIEANGSAGDSVVFANGALSVLSMSQSLLFSPTIDDILLDPAITSLSAPAILAGNLVANDTVRVRLDAQGSVVTTVGEPMVIIAGSSAIDVVYVNAGSQVDARGLGGSADQIYLTGNWADYTKTVNGKSIEFTRNVGGNTERVLVSGGTGVLNDQLFFADGNIMSNAAFKNISSAVNAQAVAALSLSTAGGASDTTLGNHTPIDTLALGKVTSISNDSAVADLVTNVASQTIRGTYVGMLRTGDKLQVQVAGGAWTDVTTVTASSPLGGTFTLTGVTLAQGSQTVSVRTVGLESNLGLTANANTNNTKTDPTLNRTIILDTSLPSGTLLANGAGLAGDADVNAAETTVLLKINTPNLKEGDKVQLQVGGANKGGVFTVSAQDVNNGFVLVNVAQGDLAAGANRVNAVFSDVAGNSTTSPDYTLTKDIDVPTISAAVLSPLDANNVPFTGVSNDAFLNASEISSLIKVSGTGFQLGDVVKVYDGGNVVGTATVDAAAVASGNLLVSVLKSDLGVDGQKSLSVVATDAAGNTSTAPTPIVVTVDNEIATPVLSIPALDSLGAAQNNLFDDANETYIELKLETVAGQTPFKAGDVIQLMQITTDGNGNSVTAVLKHADNTPYAPITVTTDGQTFHIPFLKADMPTAGNIKLGVHLNDAAGNVADSGVVTITTGLTISNAAMVAGGVSAFDVNSDIVLIASAALDPAGVAGKFITFTNNAIANGFAGQSAKNSFTVDVTDTRFVTIDANNPTRIIVKPPFDFDFGSAYTVSIDAGAFQVPGGGLTNLAVTPTNNLNFGTVAVGGGSVAAASQGQKFNADGTVTNGKKWINADGLGDPDLAATPLDLSGGDFVLVVKDRNASGASPVVNDGVGVQGTHVNVDKWGSGDAIYVDDQANNVAKLNQTAQAQLQGSSTGILQTVWLDRALGANNKEAVINIVSLEGNALSPAALDTQLLGQINSSNTRYGTAVTAIRTDLQSADPLFSLVGNNIDQAHPATITLTGNFRPGDVIDLVFYDRATQVVVLNTPVQFVVQPGFTGNSIAINITSFAGLLDGQRYSLAAKVTDKDAAVTFSPAMDLTYRTSVAPPVLSLDASNDANILPAETTILFHVSGSSLKIGDKIELQLGGGTISTGISANGILANGAVGSASNITNGVLTVTANEKANGFTYTVNKASLPGSSNDVTLKIIDGLGNIGVTASADKLVITQPAFQSFSGIAGFGPVIAGNDLSAKAYDAAGNLLGEDTTVDAGGAYTINIRADYAGAVLIEITSRGAAADFVDEHAGANTNLNTHTLRAVTSAPGVNNPTPGSVAAPVTVNITNLTDLAAQKLLGANAKLITTVTALEVTAINTQVAEKFLGVTADVTQQTPTFTVDANGASNAVNANRYGQVLKQLSDLASDPAYSGNINAAQAAVAQQITWTPVNPNTPASLGADAQKLALLAKVALNADATTPPTGANVLTVQDLTDLGIANAAGLSGARQIDLIAQIVASNAATIGNVAALQALSNKITGNGRILDLADSVPGATAPTAADYLAAGVAGVTDANLVAVNTRIAASTASALTNLSDINAIAATGISAHAASLANLEAFDGTSSAPTLANYIDAGVVGVTADNLAAVNARLASAAPGAATTPSQLQAIAVAGAAAQAKAFVNLLNFKTDPSNPAPTVSSLSDLGVVGVTTPSGLDAVKGLLANINVSASDSSAPIADQITTAVLPTLRPSQVTGMTPDQLASLTPAQVALLPTAVVAVLNPAQVQAVLAVAPLSLAQVNALPATALAQLTPTQLGEVTPSLSPAQVVEVADIQAGAAITTIAAAGLTSGGIDALSPATISGLSPAALGNLGTAALQSLDAAQVAAITTAQAAQISAAQIYDLSPTQVAALSPSAVGALNTLALQSLDAGQVAAITPAQAAQISSVQIDALDAAQVATLTPAALAGLSPSALASLNVQQVAQMTAPQIDALSPAQVAELTPTAIAGLSAAAIGSLDAAQLAAMSPAQLDALTPAQVLLLPLSALSLLSPAQLIALNVVDSAQQTALVQIAEGAAITPADAANLSSADIDAMSPAKLAALTPAAIANLGAGALGSLNASQMAVITPAQAAKLSGTQIDALSPTQVAELSPAAVGALSASAVASLAADQLLALTPAQAAQLTAAQIDALSPDQFAALSPAAFAALSIEAFGSLDALQMAKLTPLQAAQMTTQQVDELSAVQVAAMRPSVFDALSDEALASLAAHQVGTITADQIDTLSTSNIEALAPSVVAALSASATASLSTSQVAAMSLDQLGALTVDQKIAMAAANQFDDLLEPQFDYLNRAPLVSAGTFSAITKTEDSDNTTAISLGLTSMIYSAVESGQTLGFSITDIPAFVTLWKADGVTQVFTTTTGLTQTDIQGLMYKTVADANGSGNITWTVTDSGTPPRTLTENLSVTVTAANDAPTASNLSAVEFYNAATALNLTDIVTDDIDNANVTVTLTLSDPTAGTLSTDTLNGLTPTFVNGVWTVTGAKADVNDLLAALTFTPAPNYSSIFSMTTSVSDGSLTVNGTKLFTLLATPVISLHDDTGFDHTDRITSNGLVNVNGINAGATWEYSTDGTHWTVGSGNSFTLQNGTYSAVQVRQIAANGHISTVSNLGGPVQVDAIIPTSFAMSVAAGQDSYISKAESSVTVEFGVSGMAEGDKIQLKANGANIGSVYAVQQSDITNGKVSLLVNKSDISTANGSKQLTASILDSAGNTATTAAPVLVTAVSNVSVGVSAPLSVVPTGPAAGAWASAGSVSSSNNTLVLASNVASTLTSSTLGTVSQISRIELVLNAPSTTASFNGVDIKVGSASYFIGTNYGSSQAFYTISGVNSAVPIQGTGIGSGGDIYLQIDFNASTGHSTVRFGTTNAYASGTWESLGSVVAAPTQGSMANVSVVFKKHIEASALLVSGLKYYVAGDVLDVSNTPTVSGTLSGALASGSEVAVYAVSGTGVVSKLAGSVAFNGLTWTFTASSALTAGNYQLRAVTQTTGATSLNDASSALITTKAVIASDTAGAIPTIAQSVDIDQGITNQAAALSLSATRSVADNTVVIKGTLSSALKVGESIWLYDGDTFITEIKPTNANTWSTSQTLSFDNHKLNARIVNLSTGAIDAQTTVLDLGVQNRVSTINVRDDVGAAQGVLNTTAYAKQRVVTQVMSSLDGWNTIPGGGTITSTAAGWVLTGTNAGYKTITKQVGNSDNVTEMVVALNASSTAAGNNGLVLTLGSTSMFFGGRFSNTSSYKLFNDTTGGDLATVGSLGTLMYLKIAKTVIGGNTVWQFSTSGDGQTFSNVASTAPWTSNANLAMQFQKYDGNAMTVQAVQYEQQSLVTNDSTPTLTGHLDATLASGEELAIYQTVNGLGTSVTTKVGVAIVDAVTKDWTFTPTTAIADGSYVFNAVIQTAGGTSINSASVVYANKLVSINTAIVSHDLPAVVSNAVTIGGADFTYDLTAIAAPTQLRVDKINLTGTGNNTLKLALADVQLAGIDSYTTATGWSFSAVQVASLKQLLVQGNAGDVINVTDGTWAASGTVDNGGVTYNVYNSISNSEQLLLAQSLTRQGQVL